MNHLKQSMIAFAKRDFKRAAALAYECIAKLDRRATEHDTQIRALQNRAMGLPAVPDPDQEIGFVKDLDGPDSVDALVEDFKAFKRVAPDVYLDGCKLGEQPIRIHDETDLH